jgi:translocation and assembly module TamA
VTIGGRWALLRGRLAGTGRGLLFSALVVAVMPQPAAAFSLFGFDLFGSGEEERADIVDPVPYEATLVVAGEPQDLASDLEAASLLLTQQSIPPSGLVGLVARARDDQANLLARLYEEGHFGATVDIRIGEARLEEISLGEEVGARENALPVTITVSHGPLFTFGDVPVADEAAAEAAAEAGLVPGGGASTRKIRAAEAAIVLSWQRRGHAFAAVVDREVVADHARRSVDVAFAIEPGPLVRLGAVDVRGAEHLDPDFVARQADIPEGEIYHPDILDRARENLGRIDALASATVRLDDSARGAGAVPVILAVSARKRRAFGFGANYSSIDGAGGEAYWVHRNLFGEGETLRLEAEIGRLIEADDLEEYDGRAAIAFSKPGLFGPASRLDLRGTILQEDPDPYRRRGAVFEGAIAWTLGDHLTLSTGATFDWARIDDAFGRDYYSIVSLPAILSYDSRDNLLDPTRGIYAGLRGEPQLDIESGAAFFTFDTELRTYLSFDEERRFIIAARGLAGATLGADLDDIPAHRRFYAGGGGSVRGYEYLNVGPRIEGYGATGGLARIESSLEARIKVTDTIGIVPFVDAGLVTEEADLTGEDDFQVGVGLGLRYYTSVGPLRVDAAIPLDPRSGDPDFALYFGVGQAF